MQTKFLTKAITKKCVFPLILLFAKFSGNNIHTLAAFFQLFQQPQLTISGFLAQYAKDKPNVLEQGVH
jgi:hypothetical protein